MKWTGAILGFIFGGGIFGAALGYGLGNVLDSLLKKEYKTSGKEQGDFIVGLLILFSAVMKADGRILKSELNYVKRWLVENLGEDEAQNRLLILKELLQKDLNIKLSCEKINTSMQYATRLELLHMLFGIALADNDFSSREEECIKQIAGHLLISPNDYKTIYAMYFKDSSYAYTILQVEKDASIDQIKKSYRELCMKYHPDRVASLGEKAQKDAEKKFREINEAYETIKKERNFN